MDTLSEVPFHRIERYVKYPPSEGFLIMVNDAFNLHLRPEFAKASVLESDGVNATALIETFPSISEYVDRCHTGSFKVTYRRLQLAAWFRTAKLDVKAPTNTSVILDLLRSHGGIYLTADDIVPNASLGKTSTIVAATTSLFWTGSMQLNLA